MEDVTIEVKDNTGAVVEVKPVDLVAGETVATFEFVKAFTVDPEGVWNVAGVAVDLDLQEKLDAVYDAANQVELLSALQALELTDINADNIAAYQTALTDLKKDVAKAEFTKDLAQKVVTDGNVAVLTEEEAAAIVKPVNDYTNQVTLLSALQNNAFVRVNADWIADYQLAVDAQLGSSDYTEDTDGIEAIQADIDGVNDAKVGAVVTPLALGAAGASIDKEDLTEAKSLVEAYMTPDGEGEDAKAETLRQIDVQLAIVKVLEAETPAQLTSAINALSAVDLAFELDMDNFVDANRQAYIDALVAETTATNKNSITDIDGILQTENAKAAAGPIKAIDDAGTAITDVATATAAQKDALLKALKDYSDVKYVVDANKDFYVGLMVDPTETVPGTPDDPTNKFSVLNPATDDKAVVQALVDEANLAAVVNATDADKLYAALVAYGNDVKDLSVNNKSFYWTTANGNFSGVSSTATIQAAVDAANVAALQAQTNATGVLAKLGIMTQVTDVKPEFSAQYLASVQVTDGTDLVEGTVENLGDAGVDTISEVQDAIDAINAVQVDVANLKALNDATTATAVRDALTNIALEDTTNFADFINLSSADKLKVAELFLSEDVFSANGLVDATRTGGVEFGEYTSAIYAGDVHTDLVALVGDVNGLVTAINGKFVAGGVQQTPTIAGVQGELSKLKTANYTAYDALTSTQKLAAAEAFIAAYPVDADGKYVANAYKSYTAYLTAVDAAVAVAKAN